jgi:hypothetical protein
MGDEPIALVEVLGDALVGMTTEAAEEAHCLLRDHPQSALEARNRHSGAGMHVHCAIDVRPPAQDRAVQREARTVHAGALVEILIHVNLDQIGGSDLRPQQLVPFHQELSILAWSPHGAVIVNDCITSMISMT